LIFHITSHIAWEEAQQRGDYRAESLETEGFIHCSTSSQVLPVAENFYKGQNGLLLLGIEPTLLTSPVKWEPPTGGTPPPGVPAGDPFPHIYGPINVNAVVKVFNLNQDPNGGFALPDIE
jgi:uncharacterized protein (DUF952 family)